MILCEVLSYAAWIVSGLLLLWIVVEAINVSSGFDEELVRNSSDGVDELLEPFEREQGTR